MRKTLLILIIWGLFLLCGRRASAQLLPDDYDSIFPVGCGSSSSPNVGGCTNFSTALYTFLASERGGEESEYGWANFVVLPSTYGSPSFTYTVPDNDCLGSTAAGLTHTPPACYAYNANVRATETGAITYPDNSTCWVGMDQFRTGLAGAPPNFSRVAGEHYLLDCIDANQPAMTPSSQLLMKVTTSGGAITLVQDLRTVGSGITPSCPNGVCLVTAFGAQPAKPYNHGTTTASSATFTDTTDAPFVSSDVGKEIVIFGAKAAPDWVSGTPYTRHTILQPVSNNAGKFLVYNGVAGTSGGSPPTWSQSERGFTVEDSATATNETLVASASGTQFVFRGKLANGGAVPSTVTIKVNGTTVATDDGTGILTDSASGTYQVLSDSRIGYSSATENPAYYIHFLPAKAPTAAQPITATYHYGPSWVTFKDTGLPLVTTITAVNSASSVTLNTTADIAISGSAVFAYEKDPTSSIQAAFDAATANQGTTVLTRGGVVDFGRGLYLTSAALALNSQGIEIRGTGWGPWNNGNGTAGGTTIMCVSCSGTSVITVSKTWRLYLHDLRLEGLQGVPPNYLLQLIGLNTQINSISRVMFGAERDFGEPNYYASTVSELGYTFGSPAGNDNHNHLQSNRFGGLAEEYEIDILNTQANDSLSNNDQFTGWFCDRNTACESGAVHMTNSYWQFNSPLFAGLGGDGWFSTSSTVGDRIELLNATAQNTGRILTCHNASSAQVDLDFHILAMDISNANTPADARIVDCSSGPQTVRITGNRFLLGPGSPAWTGAIWNFDIGAAVYGEFLVDGFTGPYNVSELNVTPTTQTGGTVVTHICTMPDAGSKVDAICFNQTFVKNDTLNFHGFETTGQLTGWGGLKTIQLGTPVASTCTVVGAGGSTCKYEWTACQGPDCFAETGVSSAITCSSSASPPTDNFVKVSPLKGAPAYHLYRNDCAGGSTYNQVPTPFTNNTIPVAAMGTGAVFGYDDTNYGALGGTPPASNRTGVLIYGKPTVALGGGAAPTLGTIGGSGPATAGQNAWMEMRDSAGAAFWVPIWK